MVDASEMAVVIADSKGQYFQYKGRRWNVNDIHSTMLSEEALRQTQEVLKGKGKALTASEKLKRVESIVNDTAGWQLAASQLQSKLIDIVWGPSLPEPLPEYQVVMLEEEVEPGHTHEVMPQYTYCIFWRDNALITQGERDVWKFWASFGIDGSKAKHTCDVLNGVFPVIS